MNEVQRLAGFRQRRFDLPRDTQAGCAGAVNDDALIRQFGSGYAQCAEQSGQRHRAGALYVVVERQRVVAVAFQNFQRLVFAEVLPTAAMRLEKCRVPRRRIRR